MAAALEAHLAQSGAAELVHELQRMEIKMRVRMLVCTGGRCLDLDTAGQWYSCTGVCLGVLTSHSSFSAFILFPASHTAIELRCLGWTSFVEPVAFLQQFVIVRKVLSLTFLLNGALGCPLMTLGFPSSAVVKNPPSSTGGAGDVVSIPALPPGRSTGEGNGNPLQYSCLENSTDRGTWQATVQRVTKSQT